jgi:hypothetical protein
MHLTVITCDSINSELGEGKVGEGIAHCYIPFASSMPGTWYRDFPTTKSINAWLEERAGHGDNLGSWYPFPALCSAMWRETASRLASAARQALKNLSVPSADGGIHCEQWASVTTGACQIMSMLLDDEAFWLKTCDWYFMGQRKNVLLLVLVLQLHRTSGTCLWVQGGGWWMRLSPIFISQLCLWRVSSAVICVCVLV